MVAITKDGYNRKMAPELFDLLMQSKGFRKETFDDVSLCENLVAALQIEKDRLNPNTKTDAQNERELLMKDQFLIHFRPNSVSVAQSKAFLRSDATIRIEVITRGGIAIAEGRKTH
jgi:hypothetical protein